jgi:Cu(I)/Ag(I) efflux system membrane fusion protein
MRPENEPKTETEIEIEIEREAPHAPEHRFEEGAELAPPGVRAMSLVRWAMLLVTVMAAFFSAYTYVLPSLGQGEHAHARAELYRCPMHPQITSDRPGECPICHMSLELVPVDQQAPPAASASAAPSASASAAPKLGAAAKGEGPMPSAMPSAEAPLGAPPDTAELTLSFDRIQAIGVRTARVERSSMADGLRLNAIVEVPEQGRAEVHTRAAGFIESIAVRDTGVKVKAGETLVSIYSPEIFQAQQELIAMGAWAGPAAGPMEVGKPPVSGARKKLELLGLGKEAIDRVVATGKPVRAVGISSPISGYITRKNVVLGSYAMPDKVLFEIADLGRVYVIASVYPHQLPLIHLGAEASFHSTSLPGRAFATKAELIYPDIDPGTRTARVRFQIKDSDLALRPGQFGTIELAGEVGTQLTVPMDAVVDTGRAVYVFLAEEGGHFLARSVVLGEQVGDRFVILRGLAEGDRVVSGATFLIDAESRLKASLAQSADERKGTKP